MKKNIFFISPFSIRGASFNGGLYRRLSYKALYASV